MADTTTIATQGHFGTATDRIVAIATQGHFLVLSTVEAMPFIDFRLKGIRHQFRAKGSQHNFSKKGSKYRFHRNS